MCISGLLLLPARLAAEAGELMITGVLPVAA